MRAQPEGSWVFDPYRIIPSTCQVDKPFIHCERVVAKKGPDGNPSPYYVDGKLKFPAAVEKEDGYYRSVFGPVWFHNGVVLARNDANQIGGLTRLTAIREAGVEIDGRPLHYILVDNQKKFMQNPTLNRIQKALGDEVTKYFHWWLDDPEARIEIAALNPEHDKVAVRIPAWYNEIQGEAKYNHRNWVLRNNGCAKIALKGRETAKPGKYIRITYDLGTPASLIAGDFIERIKAIIAELDVVEGTQFVKSPDLEALAKVFERLEKCEGGFYFPYFSDDSCVAILCSDGIYRANVDISTCDASHTGAVFAWLLTMCSGDKRLRRIVKKAIAQCRADLVIRAVSNQRLKVKFSVKEPILYSGSVLTTLINNIANLMIASAIKSRLRPDLKVGDCELLIAEAAKEAGYIVTCVSCSVIQQLQFLKHSPFVANSGRLVPVLNLGVIGRTIGVCWGDLPVYDSAAKDIDSRRDEYNRRQTSCFKRGPRHAVLSALIDRYSPGSELGESSVNAISGDLSHEYVSAEQIALRYGVEAGDIVHLANLYARGNETIRTQASSAIMKLDYGL